jgi:CRISPR-associated protein Csx14
MTEYLNVDVSNPGQVFACLGMLELFDLLSPGATGGFVGEARFEVSGDTSVGDAVVALKAAKMTVEPHEGAEAPWGGDKCWPIVVSGRFGSMTLDPWLSPDHSRKATGLKLWAGQVEPLDLLHKLQAKLPIPGVYDPSKLFDLSDSGTPTGLDPRSAVSKSDLGFAYNSHNLKPIIYPAVDLFAMIGLEGARPMRTGGLSYAYNLWEKSLPPTVARAVLTGRFATLASSRWGYLIESRGLPGTYQNLSYAKPIEEET